MTAETPDQELFWSFATSLLQCPGVSRSTMMGLPCLRLHGVFFAACDRRTGDLLIKLSRQRVDALIEEGAAHPFAPAGRRFRQWAAVSPELSANWSDLLSEAQQFATLGAPWL